MAASLASLIVKIGADDQGISKAFADIGVKGKNLNDQLLKLGNKPIGVEATQSALKLAAAMEGVRAATQRIATNADNAAAGINRIGGVTALTSRDLDIMARKIHEGLDAYRALGQKAPEELQKVSAAIKTQQAALAATTGHVSSMKSVVTDLALGFAAMFTARAAFNFVKSSLNEASALKDLSQQTHINVEELQVLSGAMSEFGVDSDTLAKGLFTLSRKIAGGDESITNALALMGLSLKDVQGLEGEELFLKIERGLSTLQGGLRDTAAADLFGSRLGMAMAGASEGIEDTLEKTRRLGNFMSKEAVDAADEFGESIARANRSLSAMAVNMIGPLAQGFNTLIGGAERGAGKLATFWAMTKDMAAASTGLGTGTENLTRLLDETNRAMKRTGDVTMMARKETEAFVGPIQDAAEAAKMQAQALARLKSEQEKSAAAAKKTADAFATLVGTLGGGTAIKQAQRYMEALSSIGDVSKLTFAEQHKLNGVLDEAIQAYRALGTQAPKEMLKVWLATTKGVAVAGDLGASLKGLGAALPKTQFQESAEALDRWQLAAAQGADSGKELAENLRGLGVALPKLDPFISKTKQALGVLDSVDRVLSNIHNRFVEVAVIAARAASEIAKIAEKAAAAGEALSTGDWIAVAAIGISAVASAFGKLFGSNEEKKLNPIREAFVQMHGGLANLNLEATRAGSNLWALLQAKNAKQYEKAIDDLNAAFQRYDKWIEESNSELGGLLRSGQELAAKLPASFQPGIDQLVEMGRITSENAALLKSMMAGTEVDFKKMEEVAKKYNIQLDALGPAFQQAKLGDTAKTLINDFDLLARNGADVDKVLAGMRKPINDLVIDSLKFGTTIPENMKPWITQLELTGQLTDENGDALKGLSGLKFAAPIVTEFEKLITKLDELITVLSGALPNAIKNIPTPRPIDVDVNYRFNFGEPPAQAAMGGLVTANGIQHFGGGGRVLPFLSRGTDTVPAMLTPGEMVLTRGQQAALGSAGGGAATVNNHFTIHAVDAQSFETLVRRNPEAIVDAVLENVFDNRRGAYSKMRSALGLRI